MFFFYFSHLSCSTYYLLCVCVFTFLSPCAVIPNYYLAWYLPSYIMLLKTNRMMWNSKMCTTKNGIYKQTPTLDFVSFFNSKTMPFWKTKGWKLTFLTILFLFFYISLFFHHCFEFITYFERLRDVPFSTRILKIYFMFLVTTNGYSSSTLEHFDLFSTKSFSWTVLYHNPLLCAYL